jgi:hypothetical protein
MTSLERVVSDELSDIGRGVGMIGLTEALITLAVFVGPPLLIGVAAFVFLLRK